MGTPRKECEIQNIQLSQVFFNSVLNMPPKMFVFRFTTVASPFRVQTPGKIQRKARFTCPIGNFAHKFKSSQKPCNPSIDSYGHTVKLLHQKFALKNSQQTLEFKFCIHYTLLGLKNIILALSNWPQKLDLSGSLLSRSYFLSLSLSA